MVGMLYEPLVVGVLREPMVDVDSVHVGAEARELE
jgi:hypothetical protein